jgi:hypothetical protein
MDHIENEGSNNFSTVSCVFVAAVTFFIEPLPSNDNAINIGKRRLMEGIYEIRLCEELMCYDVHTKFHKDWFRHSEVDKGDAQTQTQREHVDLLRLPLFFFFKIREVA